MNETGLTTYMDRFRSIAKLRKLIAEMEVELGLEDLSPVERDLLYAFICESPGAGSVVTTNDIRKNPIVRDMSDPTLYRYIASLVEKGVLALAPGRSRGAYLVSNCRLDDPE
jgi:hypothetical protein